MLLIPVITGATGIITEELKTYLKTIPGKLSIDILYKNSYTRGIAHNKCYNLKLEAGVVGCTIGSRGEVPGERKPEIKDDDDDEEDDDKSLVTKR
jgi:hypothetical protein